MERPKCNAVSFCVPEVHGSDLTRVPKTLVFGARRTPDVGVKESVGCRHGARNNFGAPDRHRHQSLFRKETLTSGCPNQSALSPPQGCPLVRDREGTGLGVIGPRESPLLACQNAAKSSLSRVLYLAQSQRSHSGWAKTTWLWRDCPSGFEGSTVRGGP